MKFFSNRKSPIVSGRHKIFLNLLGWKGSVVWRASTVIGRAVRMRRCWILWEVRKLLEKSCDRKWSWRSLLISKRRRFFRSPTRASPFRRCWTHLLSRTTSKKETPASFISEKIFRSVSVGRLLRPATDCSCAVTGSTAGRMTGRFWQRLTVAKKLILPLSSTSFRFNQKVGRAFCFPMGMRTFSMFAMWIVNCVPSLCSGVVVAGLVFAFPVVGRFEWFDGSRVFSRNSCWPSVLLTLWNFGETQTFRGSFCFVY